jgi:hypothetical protein
MPLVPGRSYLEPEIATENLKRSKSPVTNQIPAELIQAGSKILHSECTFFMTLSIVYVCLIPIKGTFRKLVLFPPSRDKPAVA